MTRLLHGRVDAAIWLALGTVYLVWGSTYVAIAVAVRTLPPFLMSSARFLLAGAVLYAWSRRRGTPAPTPPTSSKPSSKKPSPLRHHL